MGCAQARYVRCALISRSGLQHPGSEAQRGGRARQQAGLVERTHSGRQAGRQAGAAGNPGMLGDIPLVEPHLGPRHMKLTVW